MLAGKVEPTEHRVGESKVLVKTKPDFAGVRGEECWLTFNTTRWHLFAPETGLAFF